MKLGVVSRLGEFPHKSWGSEFSTFRDCSHLELIINYPYFGPSTYQKGDIDRIRRFSIPLILHLLPDQYGINIEYLKLQKASKEEIERFLFYEAKLKDKSFDIASTNKSIRQFSIEEVYKTYKIAEKLNAELITIHCGGYNISIGVQDSLDIARCSLEEISKFSNTIKLCIENMPLIDRTGNHLKGLGKEVDDIITLTDEFDNIGICFDIGHANTIREPIRFYQAFNSNKKIWNMHIHDNLGQRDEHLPLGKGNIDFKSFFDILAIDGYEGYAGIELDIWNEQKPEKQERLDALIYLENASIKLKKQEVIIEY